MLSPLLQVRRKNLRILMATRRKRGPGRTPKWRYPHAPELSYTAALSAFVDELEAAVRSELMERLAALFREANPNASFRADDWLDDFDRIMAALRERLARASERTAEFATGIAAATSTFNRAQFQRIVNSVLGVDVFASEPDLVPVMNAWAKENASYIKSIPEKSLTEIETITMRAFRKGTRPEELAKEIAERFKVARSRAKLIAQDQIGSLNGQLTQERQTGLGITEYDWDTSHDERVRGNPGGVFPGARPSHWAMQGKICRWDDPTVYRNPGESEWRPRSGINGPNEHPGQPIRCRCIARPRFDNIIEGL